MKSVTLFIGSLEKSTDSGQLAGIPGKVSLSFLTKSFNHGSGH